MFAARERVRAAHACQRDEPAPLERADELIPLSLLPPHLREERVRANAVAELRHQRKRRDDVAVRSKFAYVGHGGGSFPLSAHPCRAPRLVMSAGSMSIVLDRPPAR